MPDSYPPEKERLIRAIADSYRHLTVPEILRELREQNAWLEYPPQFRATVHKTQKPEMSDAAVAELVGVNRSTLHRSDLYQQLKALLTAPAEPMRGTADSDGNIEAWE